MFHCPKCSEVIGETVTSCPFCKYEIKMADLRKYQAELDAIWEKANVDAKKQWKHSLVIFILIEIAFFFEFVGLVVLFYYLGVEELTACGLALAAAVALTFFLAVKTKSCHCPHCGRNIHLGGSMYFAKSCPKCGGILR